MGGSITYTITVNVPSTYTGNLVNTATVTAPAGVTDPVPGNNIATDYDTRVKAFTHIPTLNEWGWIFLLILINILGICYLRKMISKAT